MKVLRQLRSLVGELAEPLTRYASLMRVDAALHSALASTLEWKDWTYLLLDNGYGVTEVVKVTGVLESNYLSIERAQELTCAQAFTTAVVKYVETVEAVLENSPLDSLTIVTSGGVGLFEGNVLEYPTLSFTHLGNTEAVGDDKVILSIKHLTTCCTDGQPPEIPLELLPYRVIDSNELREIDDAEIRSVSG